MRGARYAGALSAKVFRQLFRPIRGVLRPGGLPGKLSVRLSDRRV